MRTTENESKSNDPAFKSQFATNIFNAKYALFEGQTWEQKATDIVYSVTENLMPKDLQDELREYGAWDEIQLQDHNANLMRILWIAAGDIQDGK